MSAPSLASLVSSLLLDSIKPHIEQAVSHAISNNHTINEVVDSKVNEIIAPMKLEVQRQATEATTTQSNQVTTQPESTITSSNQQSTQPGGCEADANYTYNEPLDWCYRLMFSDTTRKNATAAYEFCKLDAAHMVKINSQERNTHLLNILYSQSIDSVWIGGYSPNEDNNFIYEDGSPLTYSSWRSNNPSGLKFIRLLSKNNYEWQDAVGSGNRRFICER
ncbi:C-type lectin lectoxin-Lei1-like [Argopecten irradians]|uniref:C-type lectin lectoxin-Lei1-like n=1 Tax=Argopecten irradians TaxID=31199 RepID=UPI003719B408